MLESVKKAKSVLFSSADKLSSFHIEIDKSNDGYSVVVSGVKRIADYSDSEIKLKCRFGSVNVKGRMLSISLYENKTVEISGKLSGLELDYDKS